MNKKLENAKGALDKIIKLGRVHMYKPIQIAEILYYAREERANIAPLELDTYRIASRKWRDAVSIRLVGRKSTSSSRYQDNLFDKNAMPPRLLAILDDLNKEQKGLIENYIYHRIANRLQDVVSAYKYIEASSLDTFSLQEFLDFFEQKPGLKRSIDKTYEIVVYALFSTLIEELKATISLTLDNPDPDILADFARFTKYVLGIDQDNTRIIRLATIYRAGVTNAADRGLDMWTNFGPAIQVKHLRLDVNLADDIADELITEDVVIVCKTADAALIESLLNQMGQPIRGIITQNDLMSWYQLCLTKYKQQMGDKLLQHLRNEFLQEFPLLEEMGTFLKERGYQKEQLAGKWGL